MYRPSKATETTIAINKSYIGETIEQKVQRILNNKEPISDGAPLIYTERKHGVLPEHDIRTDKWEIAVDAMEKVQKTKIAKREERINQGKKTEETETPKTKETTNTPSAGENQQS